jgi:hypothetical protein
VDEFVRQAYRLVLRREPEPDVLSDTVARLEEGTLSRATLLRDIVTSEEFTRLRALDDAIAFAKWARGEGERPRELEAPPESDERPVEIAWCLSRYRGEPRVLDAGYAFAEPAYLTALVDLGAKELVGVDLAQADVTGLTSIQADLRELPFDSGSFDVVFCISTIEHVGADNSGYGITSTTGGMDDALAELRRVGGRVLITVPCGEREDHGWFVQDTPEGWRHRFGQAGFLIFEDEIYEATEDGWRSAPEFTPAGVHYGDRGAAAVLCAELHPRTLGNVVREAARRLRS